MNAISFQFVDALTGYFIGNYEDSAVGCAVFRTTDGGSHWDSTCTVGGQRGTALCFPDARHGYMVNAKHDALLRTSDGGRSWAEASRPGIGCWVWDVSFTDSASGFLSSCDSFWRLWRTDDAGSTWSLATAWRDTEIDRIQFLDRLRGYVQVGCYDDRRGNDVLTVFRTDDAGRSWSRVFGLGDLFESDPDQMHMQFVSSTIGYVSAVKPRSGDYDDYRLYRTTDGQHFHRLRLPIRKFCDMGPMSFVKGTSVGYVHCKDSMGFYWLLKTVDGGGESLDFWRPLATMPAKPKRGVLLASVPDSNALYVLDKATQQLRSYGLGSGVWQEKKPIPVELKDGSMVYDGVGLVVSRTRSKEFWSYAPDFDTWARLPDIPGETKMKPGSCITSDNGDPLFALKGGKTCEFWSFDRDAGQWLRRLDIPGSPVTKGACLACDNDYVYALKGGKGNEFWAFSIEGDTWFRLPDVVGAGIKEGSCLAANNIVPGNSIACLKGGTSECWYYTLDGYWKLAPGIPGRKKVKKGAQLTFDDAGTFYAIRDARSLDIWQTENLSMLFSEPHAGQPVKENSQSGATQGTEPGIDVHAISSTGRVSIAASGADWSSVSLLDVSGRVVATVRPDRATAGALEIGDHIPPGIYVVRIQTPTKAFIRKLILAR